MNKKIKLFGNIRFTSALALSLAVTVWSPGAARADDHPGGHAAAPAAGATGAPPAGHGDEKEMPMKDGQSSMTMNQIKTQAEAEALKPGDAMSMACDKCKSVMVQKVGADQAHVKMMTVGEKTTCAKCEGSVTVVGTGKGEGKNEEVKHVCTKCGDDAMFCAATKAGSGAMKDGKDMKDIKDMKKDPAK